MAMERIERDIQPSEILVHTVPEAEFDAGLLAAIPHLEKYARHLGKGGSGTKDLVQETLARALKHRKSFKIKDGDDVNERIRVWAGGILHNHFTDLVRRSAREVEDSDGAHAKAAEVGPTQDSLMTAKDMLAVFMRLDSEDREMLQRVSGGDTYEKVATELGMNINTLKTRINRARAKLADMMEEGQTAESSSSPRKS